jgi:HK97 family phage major capsid protein
LKKNAYDLILSKHAELSSIITKCATESRAPSPEEITLLETLKADIEATRSEWESTGRSAFLASLAPDVSKSSNGQIVLKAGDSFSKHLEGTYPDEFKGLSLGKLLRGYIAGDWSDATLEQKAMSSSPLSSGGMLIPTPLAAEVIDLARNQTRVLMAGAITVPMGTATLKYARLSQDASATWTAEASDIALSAAAFDSVTFTAHKLAALVGIDNELLADAENADATIQNSIAKALALALDYGGLYGSGATPQPQGLHGIVPTLASGGVLTNFDPMLRAIADVRAANFEPNAVLYSSRTADSLARLKTGLAGDQRQLPGPTEFAALSKYVTNQIPNNFGTGTNESQAFIGQWDELALGLRASLQIEVSREGSYFDGTALQSAFSRDQTVIRAILRADWQPLHTAAFAEVTGIFPS